MTQDDVLFGYRLQLFALAARTSVVHGCRTVRGAPLDLLRLEAPGRPPRPGDAQAPRAPASADAQPAASDNGNESKGTFTTTAIKLGAAHTRIHAGRPQTNGHVEALHKTILDECWRPAFARYSAASAASWTPTCAMGTRPRVRRPWWMRSVL
jgi:transposase InsO family protein